MAGSAACRQCGRSFEPYGGHYRVYCKECTAKADKAIAKETAVQCKECGKEFAAPSRSFHFCSDACRAEGARRYHREYRRKYMADPAKRATAMAYIRASAAARRARKRGGRPPQKQALPRVDPNAEPTVCRLCGRTFAQYGRGVHAYCKRCTAKADREIARTVHAKCRECGKRFTAATRNARYCSDKCRADGAQRGRRESIRRVEADPEKRSRLAAQSRSYRAARRGVADW